jgi:hypothetical protein
MPYAYLLGLGLIALLAALLYRRRARLAGVLTHPLAVPALVVGLGLLLRVSLLAATRLGADEALYSSWGLLIASGKDVFLKTVAVDKPPLLPYTLALSFKLFGPTETAARLPNLAASVAAIAILYALAARLYDRRVAALSALMLALSPFDLQLAPTAFTDPLMVALGLGACLLALSGHFLAAGLALGLAAAAKPTAILLLPAVLFLAGLHLHRAGRLLRPWRAGLALSAGSAAVVVAVAFWDNAIRLEQPAILDTAASHYAGGLGLVALPDVLPRLRQWLGHLQLLTASPLLNGLLVVGGLLLLVRSLRLWRQREDTLVDGALAIYALGFVAVHTIVSFGVWDRYLLPLVPVAALLLARIALLPCDLLQGERWPTWGRGAYSLLAALLLAGALLRPASVALRHGYPLGSDDGRHQGIEDVAAYFRGNVPAGAILFHHWLGWHYAYYMFDYPYQFPYYPDPAYLLDYVRRVPDTPKYIVFGSWFSPAEVEATLAGGGWRLHEVYRTYRADGSASFVVYRIERSP